MSVLDRWAHTLVVREARVRALERAAAYWRREKQVARRRGRTTRYSHCGAQLAKRERELRIARAERDYAKRVVKRHGTVTKTSDAGVELIKRFEGFAAEGYDDGVGVWTIGFGTTSSDVSPLPKRVTMAQAEEILREALRTKYEPAVRDAIKRYGLTGVSSKRFDALVSFVYNLGAGALKPETPNFETLHRALRSGDWRAIADALPLYCNPGTPVHDGLLARRRAERRMILAG